MSTDYRTLLAERLHQRTHDDNPDVEFAADCQEQDGWVGDTYLAYKDAADTILATRIPDLCNDCDQGDVKHLPYSQTCVHPNAPTIADLLRWGENVAKAVPDSTHDLVLLGRQRIPWATALLAALRTEADR